MNLKKLRALAKVIIDREAYTLAHGGTPLYAEVRVARACLALCDYVTQSDHNGPRVINEHRELARVLEELGLS
jgi:hypothetical protein